MEGGVSISAVASPAILSGSAGNGRLCSEGDMHSTHSKGSVDGHVFALAHPRNAAIARVEVNDCSFNLCPLQAACSRRPLPLTELNR